MNREHLFRAKRVDNGEWVYGFVVEAMDVNDEKKSYIIESPANYYRYGEFATVFEVIPDTICEFTGLKDKNGKRIFEGDKVVYPKISMEGSVVFVGYSYMIDEINEGLQEWWDWEKLEVIGTIFDKEKA